MDIIRFTDEFFRMEKELDLFSQSIEGIPWWDPVRHGAFCFIYHRMSGANIPQKNQVSFLYRLQTLIIRNLMAWNLKKKITFRNYEVLALRAARFRSENGDRKDLVLDDILNCISGKVLVIDTFPYYHHIRTRSRIKAWSRASNNWCNLNNEIKLRFGLDENIEKEVITRFNEYRMALDQYANLLKKVSPKLIVVVQNGIQKALFKAANEQSITVIEAQHGLINYVHPAYSYPVEIEPGTLDTLPKYFLAFSQHWLNQCHYPVFKSIVVGNRQLNVSRVQIESNAILVVSADIYEDAIEEFLRPAAAALPQWRFIYKLHPNQFGCLRTIKERLASISNVEVIGPDISFKSLIGRCSSALCIQSTGVYEALQAGLRVYILARQDYQTHADIFNHPNVKVCNDHVEFIGYIRCTEKSVNSTLLPLFFENFNVTTVTEFFADLGV